MHALWLHANAQLEQQQEAEKKGKPSTIMLRWTASTSTDVTRQYIYRGTAPGAEDYANPIVAINGNTVTSYLDADPAIVSKGRYCYTLKTYNGMFSAPTAEACVKMP
jgi:hypothetical protein